MEFTKTLALGAFLASTLAAGGAFAKGHDNGFGGGAKGSAAGMVDENVTNRDGSGSETTYGKTDASVDAMDDVSGRSDAAQARNASTPPSERGDRPSE